MKLWSRGYLTAFSLRGAPVRFHWSLPIGALLVGRGAFVPGIWLGYVLLVFVHEAGHAAVVRRTGSSVVAIHIHALGGECRWSGDVSRFERAMIAWGGVWAQAALFAVTAVYVLLVGPPRSWFLAQLIEAFTYTNLWLAALNLMPIRPLDGAEAWPLVGMLRARRRERLGLEREAAIKRAREGVKLRLAVAVEARKDERAIAVMDEVDDLENGVTPEVEAVLERARAIAAEEGEREALLRAERPRRGG